MPTPNSQLDGVNASELSAANIIGVSQLNFNAGAEGLAANTANDGVAAYDGWVHPTTLVSTGGADTISYAAAPGGVEVNLATGIDSLGDTLTGVENVIGSGQGDIIIGNTSANTITENGSGNTIDGAGGADTLIASGGDNTFILRGGGESVTASGGSNTASFVDYAGNVTVNFATARRQLTVRTRRKPLNLKNRNVDHNCEKLLRTA
jgi:hypothetical protein